MKFNDLLTEQFDLKSGNAVLDKSFRLILTQIFNSNFVNRLDKELNETLILGTFDKTANVMAYTNNTKVCLRKDLISDPKTAQVYLFHELFHVLDNLKTFPEITKTNKLLAMAITRNIPKNKINQFLTGISQNIHSSYQKEALSYLSNNKIDWSINPKIKPIYIQILQSAGIFNLGSQWWKDRLGTVIGDPTNVLQNRI